MNADAAAQNLSATDVFMASRLIMSLLIGFMAGVAAGLALGLAKILAIGAADIDVLLGIAAAGYAGTDFVEAFAPTITGRAPLTSPKLQPAALAPAIPSPALVQTFATPATQTAPGMLNPKYGVTFGSLVPGGFFSGDPDDLNVHRSIRTNNPGALNFTSWQKSRLGYVGTTQPDNSPDHNITTIYRTPEHGVAAWYHLLAVRYNFPAGNFTLHDLATRYSGGGNANAINAYIAGWNRFLNPPIAPNTLLAVNNPAVMLALAKAMFSHEAGVETPLHDDQITFAITREQAATLPA